MDDNNNIETITLYNNPDGDIFPEKDLPENARLLRGFEWRGDERIKSKDDIYPADEVEIHNAIVKLSQKANDKRFKPFEIILEIETSHDSDIILFYKDGTNLWFDDKHMIWEYMHKDIGYQNIIFNFPIGATANDIRIDIGTNQFEVNKQFTIKGITINFLDKSFKIEEKDFEQYFKPNQFIKKDNESKKYYLDNQSKGNFDPYFEALKPLKDILLKTLN
jgi:hypothetical protein